MGTGKADEVLLAAKIAELRTRAETAEAALAEWKLLGQQESERAEAAIVRAQTAEAALAQCQHDLATMANRVEQADTALATMIERKEYFRQCWEQAEAALAESKAPVKWTRVGKVLGCPCGYLTTYTADEFLFCPGCAHPVDGVTE